MPASLAQFSACLEATRPASPLDPSDVAELFALADVASTDDGQVLTRQFAPARHLYLLQEGEVRFQIRLDESNEDLDVGTARATWTPIGWSALRSPGRYATTVVCLGPGRVLRFDLEALLPFLEAHPQVGAALVRAVLSGAIDLLATMRRRLADVVRPVARLGRERVLGSEEEAYNRAPPPLGELLRRSTFFEVFDDADLRALSEGAESFYFCRGEVVCRQGEVHPGLWVLATGRVSLSQRPEGRAGDVTLQTISATGRIVAWAGWDGVEPQPTSVVAVRDCTVYRLSADTLKRTLTAAPRRALTLLTRLLWLVANHLSVARALFISRRFEQEILAIRNLLEQSCTQLSVSSPLHRLPHLLDSAYTLGDAFASLDRAVGQGDALEQRIAQLCLDLLGEVRREHEFFEALRSVYHSVVTAPESLSAREVRRLCARGFREAFRLIRCVVAGEEHLPDTPGHVFIFNHLKNHEYNTLPNNFQLTLDSHFVSSVILDRKYGDSGIRVVRVSRGTEYGHQNYYDRLGHISVYTAESDELRETADEKRARRSEFFETAGRYLGEGVNLILSPEGTSYWTEDSPGPFRPGAFRLAAHLDPEPWIVPIAVAHFDRRMHSTVCAVVIKPPFKISERLGDTDDVEALRRFLDDYRQEYAGYVREARALADDATRTP